MATTPTAIARDTKKKLLDGRRNLKKALETNESAAIEEALKHLLNVDVSITSKCQTIAIKRIISDNGKVRNWWHYSVRSDSILY